MTLIRLLRQGALGIPLWGLFGTVMGMGIVVYAITRPQLRADYPYWAHASQAFHESLWLSGPLLGIMVVILAWSAHPRASMVDAVTYVRSGLVVVLTQVTVLSLSAVCGLLVGLTPLLIDAHRHATWGHLNIIDVGIGVAGTGMYVSLAFAAAYAFPSLVTAPIVGLLYYLVPVLFDEFLRPMLVLSPVHMDMASPRFMTNPAIAIFTIISDVVISAAAVSIALWWRNRNTIRNYASLAGIWGAASVALGIIAFLWQPAIFVVDEPVPTRCDSVDTVEVCVHAANADSLAALMRASENLIEAGLPDTIRRVSDASISETTYPGHGVALISIRPGPFDPDIPPSSVEDTAANMIAEHALLGGCAGITDPSISSYGRLQAVTNRMLDVAKYPELASLKPNADPLWSAELANWTADDLGRWIRENNDQIVSCTIGEADLSP